MRIFLGNPPWTRPGWYGVRAGSRWPHFEREGTHYMPFPFYMAYASAVLKQHGHETMQIDACADRMSDDEFIARVERFKPDIIVQEIATASLNVDTAMTQRLRKLVGKDALIFWAGAHSWLADQPDIVTSTPEIDGFFKGEYEYTLLDVVEARVAGRSLGEVQGLMWRDETGTTVTNPKRALLKNIDEYPWPDRDALPMHKYEDCLPWLPAPNLQMWASRGCPFKCDFCIWPQFMYGGRNYRVRNELDIVNELEHAMKRYNMKSAYFDDDTFNIGKDRIARYAKAIKERCPGLIWGAMSRADTFDRKTLEILSDAGLKFIKYGVESGDQAMVDAIEKNLDLNKVRDAVRWAKELGVATHLTFSFGHPGETWETARRTIDFALELSPESLQFSLMQPFPGSELYRKVTEKGLLVETDLSKYDGYSTSPIRTETLSSTDLESILQEAHSTWRKHLARKQLRNISVSQAINAIKRPQYAVTRLKEAIWGQ